MEISIFIVIALVLAAFIIIKTAAKRHAMHGGTLDPRSGPQEKMRDLTKP